MCCECAPCHADDGSLKGVADWIARCRSSTLSDVQGQLGGKYGNILTYSEKAAVDQHVINLDVEGFFIRQGVR